MQRISIVIWGVIGVCAGVAQSSKPGKLVHVKKFGYQFTLPDKWNYSFANAGIPTVFNYPPESGVAQGLVPDNGAMIICVPDLSVLIPGTNDSIRERIAASADSDHKVVAESRVPLAHNSYGFARDIMRVDSDIRDDDQADTLIRREVDYYFRLENTRFKLQLTYWRGDPKARYFESIVKMILDSIKVNPR